jgi:hypothetical protein
MRILEFNKCPSAIFNAATRHRQTVTHGTLIPLHRPESPVAYCLGTCASMKPEIQDISLFAMSASVRLLLAAIPVCCIWLTVFNVV